MLALMKAIWRGWKNFVHSLNSKIAFVLMSFVYFTAVGPVAMGFKIFSPDPLDRGLGDPELGTYALDTRIERQDIRRAQRPW